MSKGKILESIQTAYKNYFKKSEFKRKLTKPEYLKLLNGFNDYIMECVLKGETVYLPGKLGVVQVVGKKKNIKVTEKGISGLSIDWIETKKLWKSCEECKQQEKKIYNFNEHSDGVGYRFMWSRTAVTLGNKYFYTYCPNRNSKRELAKRIREGTEYLILEGRDALHTKSLKALKDRKL
jgi:hypothetical protein